MKKKFMILLKKDPVHSIQILRRYEAKSQYQEREYGLWKRIHSQSVLIVATRRARE